MVVLDEEAKHRLDFLEKQVREEARERADLKKQVQSYEELSQRRNAGREAERLEQRGVAVRLAQSDELLRASREELRLDELRAAGVLNRLRERVGRAQLVAAEPIAVRHVAIHPWRIRRDGIKRRAAAVVQRGAVGERGE